MNHFLAMTMAVAAVGWLAIAPASAGDLSDFSPYVRADGSISLPDDFRSWRYLGTWSVAGDDPQGGASGFHNAYPAEGSGRLPRDRSVSRWHGDR